MSSPPLLDFEALVAPIPGARAEGDPVPFEVSQQLEDLRREIDLDSFSPTDPTRPEAPKKADWPGIIQLAQQTLRETSKDLLVAARLTEALAKAHGFAGLRDGLHLLYLLVEQCWDRLHPVIEAEDDLEVRAARFNWLDEPDRGARFPGTLRLIPLLAPDQERFGWQHWRDSQTGKSKLTAADIERGIQNTSREYAERSAADLDQCWQELELLSNALAVRMKTETTNYAPSLGGIREAVQDCRMLARQIVQKKGGGKPAAEVSTSKDDTATPPSAASPAAENRMETREEIYGRVAEAAAKLQRIEPHSPVPYLLLRAVEMGSMAFPDLMKALILNADVLKVMNRELGIKDQPEKK